MMASRTQFFAILIAVAVLGIGGSALAAVNLTELYTVQVIVTGTGEANREIGFRECLSRVLVKVSGDQNLARDEAAASLPRADGFISSYRYRDHYEGRPIHDEQGTYDRPHDLTCVFDREKIDGLLKSLGRSPWLEERPRLVAFVSIRQPPKAFVLARNGAEGPYMRQSLGIAAEPLGLQVELPDAATLSSAALTADTLPKVDLADLGTIAGRFDGAMALAGSLTWSDEERGWIAHWRLALGEKTFEWQARGVSFDEAFRRAMGGSLQILSGNGQPW